MIDTQTALEAQQNITWIADQWDALTARLGGSGGGALGVRVQTSERPPLPIDVHVSDLIAEIDWKIARHYCQILLEETDDVRMVPTTTQGKLRLIAQSYGHFVTTTQWAHTFTDDATDYRNRVEKTLNRPEPPEYLGPCPINECAGELYAHGSASTVRCPACLTDTTRDAQRAWVAHVARDRMYTYSEVPRMLKILNLEISIRTWERWTSTGTPDRPKTPKIHKDNDGLYQLPHVLTLALQSPTHTNKEPFYRHITQEALAQPAPVG